MQLDSMTKKCESAEQELTTANSKLREAIQHEVKVGMQAEEITRLREQLEAAQAQSRQAWREGYQEGQKTAGSVAQHAVHAAFGL